MTGPLFFLNNLCSLRHELVTSAELLPVMVLLFNQQESTVEY